MDKKIEKALNEQINLELASSYAYLAMALHAEHESLEGTAAWMYKQAEEEREHAAKFCEFVLDRGGKVELTQLASPKNDFKSLLEVFETALAHEKKVSASIHNLYKLAKDGQDYPLESMLKWFIDEQVEEESNVQSVIDKINLVGDKGAHLYLLDKELGKRKD